MPVSRLPPAPDPLIGRDAELDTLCGWLDTSEPRLLTLTGPPGVGKTRLAVAAATVAQQSCVDPVTFVDLTPVRDSDLVTREMCRALGLDDSAGSPVERLTAALRDTDVFMVLDNFEHVLDSGPAVSALLGTCPGLRLLVTSRERLRLRAEREYPVAALAVPEPTDVTDPARLAAVPAVTLLLERARGLQPDLAVTAATATAFTEICVGLDGLPLALELAAARLKLFTPDELASQLRERVGPRMSLLTGGPRDVPDRHRTLRDAIAWSHQLLDEHERTVFRRLSVFVGGWTLQAAQQVCTPPGTAPGEFDVVQMTASLIDKSLVRRVAEPAGYARFTLLESLREYAADLLDEHDETDTVRARHAGYYAALGCWAEASIGTRDEVASVSSVGYERGNLRAALEQLRAAGRAADALSVAAGLGWYAYTRGQFGDGQLMVDRALTAAREAPDPPSDDTHAAGLIVAGVLALARGGPDRAEALLSRGLEINDRLRDPLRRSAIAAAFRGHLARARDEHDLAATHHTRAGELFERLGNPAGQAWARYDLGLLARRRGDLVEAAAYLNACLRRFRDIDYDWAIACAAWALATVTLRRATAEDAAGLLGEALDRFAAVEDGRGIAQCLETAAAIGSERGDPELAARLLGAAAGLRERLVAPLPEEEWAGQHGLARAVGRALGAQRAEQARSAGHGIATGEAVALARRAVDDAPGAAVEPLPDNPLTRRERQVARLVAAGRTNHQIGRALGIAEKTTEVHVHHIMGKLNAGSRAEIAAWVTRRGETAKP